MRIIVIAKLLSLTLFVVYLVVGLTHADGNAREANKGAAANRCT